MAALRDHYQEGLTPRIVGRDFAGRVVDGPPGLLAAEVWGAGGDLGISRNGTHGEYVALQEAAVARQPKSLSVQQAADVGVPFVPAFSALFRAGQR